MFIRDVIRDREPYSMRASASVLEAIEFMAQRRIGAVCVLDEEGRLIGVFSERDLLNRVVVPGHNPATMKLGEVTSPLRAVVRRDETSRQAIERMELIGSSYLPVVDGQKWVGMLSIRDLLRVELTEHVDDPMHRYEINIYWSNEDDAYVAEVPELPGCMAHGQTYESAAANANEAIQLWIDTAREFGDPIPEPKEQRFMLA